MARIIEGKLLELNYVKVYEPYDRSYSLSLDSSSLHARGNGISLCGGGTVRLPLTEEEAAFVRKMDAREDYDIARGLSRLGEANALIQKEEGEFPDDAEAIAYHAGIKHAEGRGLDR